jgi:PAS domain S-box-containing protein
MTLDPRPTTADDPRHAAELLELGDAFFELDASWRIVRVNWRQEALSRRPRDETVGRTFAEVWPELATPESRYWREYHRCMTERVPVQFQAYHAPLDLWTGVTAYPVSTGGIAVFFRDIGGVKRAEQESRRLAAIVENTDDAIISKDIAGVIRTWNAAAERLFGYRADEVIGRPVALLLPPDRADEEDRILAALRAGERIDHFETVRVRKDGSLVAVSVTVSPLRDAAGEIVGASKIARDNTDRVEAERALRDAERRYRSVFEQAAIGMGRVRFSDARWMEVNDTLCRMLGRSREEMLATPWPEITHPEDLDLDLGPFRRMAAGELDTYTVEKRFLHADGHHVWARLTLSAVRDAAGRPEYEIAVIEDVTAQRRAESELRAANEALRDADRRKDEFLGMLSHELRNPLAPIRSSLYILDRSVPGGEQARRAREVANRQVTHLTRLVDDLLDVTRVARGKIELRRAALDVGDLVRRTADDYRALMRERQLELEVSLPDREVSIDGDATRLAQVLGNLLSNAAKFTPAGGRVTLGVEERGGSAVVRVRDTGVGIADDLLPTIFDPFTQAEQTLARSEGGLGLGLALVKGLTRLHGGSVSVASRPGEGTEFQVALPLSRGAEAEPGSRAAPAARRRYRVLVVDDNVDAAESLADLVRLFGHDAEVAHDGPSAVAGALAGRPDVVLCDLGLPGMDGYEVARAVRARLDGDVRLVAVSGYAQPEDVRRSAEAGFDAHVAKPPDPRSIESVLAGPAPAAGPDPR